MDSKDFTAAIVDGESLSLFWPGGEERSRLVPNRAVWWMLLRDETFDHQLKYRDVVVSINSLARWDGVSISHSAIM